MIMEVIFPWYDIEFKGLSDKNLFACTYVRSMCMETITVYNERNWLKINQLIIVCNLTNSSMKTISENWFITFNYLSCEIWISRPTTFFLIAALTEIQVIQILTIFFFLRGPHTLSVDNNTFLVLGQHSFHIR